MFNRVLEITLRTYHEAVSCGQADAPFELDEENARKLKWALIMLGVVSLTNMPWIHGAMGASQADGHNSAAITARYIKCKILPQLICA